MMKTYLECLPCVVRQALEGARHVSDDEKVQQEILRRAGQAVSEADLHESSPVLIAAIHRIIREVTGRRDPYNEAKKACNESALRLYPEMKRMVESSSNPFETAVRLAIAGNIIDFVVDPNADRSNVRLAVEEALEAPLKKETLDEFQTAVYKAHDILYLGDNAGEIVFDKLLIEQMPPGKVTFVVKGNPVVNDVMYEDAQSTSLTELADVIDNGSDFPGTVLDTCSEAFQQRFREADLVVAKGQGNYESLDEINKQIFFMFRAKCIVIEKHLGVGIGTLMLVHNSRR